MIRTARARRGFTLVELMVAASMCILGMWLFTWLYKQGLDSFRNAKAQGDLSSQQRAVIELLRRDLAADHFLDEDRKPNRGRKLSDQLRTLGAGYVAPRGGYFEASAPVPTPGPSVEPADSDGFGSWRSNHAVRFTAILPGGVNYKQFSAQTPAGNGNQYFGTAAEVAYFLVQNGSTPNNIPTYDLYRRQRLCALTDDDAAAINASLQANAAATRADAQEVIALRPPPPGPTPGPLQVSTFADLRTAANRVQLTPMTIPARFGDDKILSNVISFELKFTGNALATTWPTRFTPVPPAQANSDYPFDWLPPNLNGVNYGARFDSASTNPQFRPSAVHVRLRLWNPKTQQTRQTTVVVDL